MFRRLVGAGNGPGSNFPNDLTGKLFGAPPLPGFHAPRGAFATRAAATSARLALPASGPLLPPGFGTYVCLSGRCLIPGGLNALGFGAKGSGFCGGKGSSNQSPGAYSYDSPASSKMPLGKVSDLHPPMATNGPLSSSAARASAMIFRLSIFDGWYSSGGSDGAVLASSSFRSLFAVDSAASLSRIASL